MGTSRFLNGIFFSKRPRVTSAASSSGPSTSSVMCVEGEQGDVTRVVLPDESLKTSHASHSTFLPVKSPDEFEKSSEHKFDFLFGAREDSELSIAASASGMESLEADDSAGAEPPGTSCLQPCLLRKLSFRLEWTPPPRLSIFGWMIGS